MKIVIVTGGFDPVHSGHIAYLNAAAQLGDQLFVGVNSDAWLERKKGRAFMNYDERAYILRSMKEVYDVVSYDDDCGDIHFHQPSFFKIYVPTIKISQRLYL